MDFLFGKKYTFLKLINFHNIPLDFLDILLS